MTKFKYVTGLEVWKRESYQVQITKNNKQKVPQVYSELLLQGKNPRKKKNKKKKQETLGVQIL